MLIITCPGQGSQTPGMLSPWLEDPTLYQRLGNWSEAIGIDLIAHGTVSDAEVIKDTTIAQPLIVASSLLSLSAVLDRSPGQAPHLVAGHSVGEFAAAAVAGVLTEVEALQLVAVRGREMAAAAAVTPTGMAAVLGGDFDEVIAHLESMEITAANINGGGQIVAAGTLEQLAALAENPPAKTRIIQLQVAGAFHTEHMRPAITGLQAATANITPRDPLLPLLSNRDGQRVLNGSEAIARLVAQIANPVRWDLCQTAMSASGVTAALELAPAGVLTGLAKRTMKNVELLALKSPDQLDAAVALLTEHAPQHPTPQSVPSPIAAPESSSQEGITPQSKEPSL